VSADVYTRAIEVIEPPRGWPRPDLRELWRYRDLVYFLARRDIAVRYRQTAIGAAWAIIQPVAFAAVFGMVITLFGRVPTEGIPYTVFALTGMCVWLFVSASLSLTAASTVTSAALLSKVYFPRLAIPLAAIIPPIVDFLIALLVLFGAMAIYGVAPSINIVALPGVFLLAVAIALGAGLWLSALAARYRDVQHVVPFLVQIGLFISPVLYPLSLIPDRWQVLYSLNPLVGVLEGFRWAVLGTNPPGEMLLIPLAVGALLLLSGLMVFARASTTFADEL
jgi:lipopolysaccharide transport system permease protein